MGAQQSGFVPNVISLRFGVLSDARASKSSYVSVVDVETLRPIALRITIDDRTRRALSGPETVEIVVESLRRGYESINVRTSSFARHVALIEQTRQFEFNHSPYDRGFVLMPQDQVTTVVYVHVAEVIQGLVRSLTLQSYGAATSANTRVVEHDGTRVYMVPSWTSSDRVLFARPAVLPPPLIGEEKESEQETGPAAAGSTPSSPLARLRDASLGLLGGGGLGGSGGVVDAVGSLLTGLGASGENKSNVASQLMKVMAEAPKLASLLDMLPSSS